MEHQNQLSIVFPCFGRYELVEPQVSQTLKVVQAVKEKISLILALDGNHWQTTPLIQVQKNLFPRLQTLTLPEECSLPAVLYNAGLKQVNTPYVSFVWPGCGVTQEDLEHLLQAIEAGNNTSKPVYALDNQRLKEFPFQNAIYVVRYGWLQCIKLYELNQLAVRLDVFQEIGCFDPSRIIQKEFDWEWLLRLARHSTFVNCGTTTAVSSLSFEDYPYHQCFNLSKELAQRYLLRIKRSLEWGQINKASEDERDFLADLPGDQRRYLIRAAQIKEQETLLTGELPETPPYKITIVTSHWDFPHNQLCFFNYLDRLSGKGFATYRVLLDSSAQINDLKADHLVIFSRCRNPQILKLIEYCTLNRIPTLYMIDDNWLAVAKDWPEHYGQVFRPGNPNFDTFIAAIRQTTATLVYNPYLEEDLKPFARKIIRLETNIDLELFQPRVEPNPLIGYCGSLRYTNEAFYALAEVAAEHPEFKVLIFGHLTAEQEALFRHIPIVKEGYHMYFDYYKKLKALRPLILLAPLDASRSSLSKCPNKYLEIAAAGSVGIYSNVYPYSAVVRDGVTGLLVEDRKNSWKEKITYLLQNPELQKTIRENSWQDLQRHFATEVVLPRFCAMIESIIRGEI